MTINNKVHSEFNCFDVSIVNGRRESVLFSFSVSARPLFKSFEQPTSSLFKKLNEDTIGDLPFHLGDNDGNIVDFNGKISTLTVILFKKLNFF